MKYWEIIVSKMIKAGFSMDSVSAFDDDGRTVWIVDAHRKGTSFVEHSEEIAEEVAQVNPALILVDKEGKPYSVR